MISAARLELERGDVDYEATLATKLAIARTVFDQQGQETLQVHAHPRLARSCRTVMSMPEMNMLGCRAKDSRRFWWTTRAG